MPDNDIPKDPYEEALEKAGVARLLLQKYYDLFLVKESKESEEEKSVTFSAAWNVIRDIQLNGFPVEILTAYHRPYDDFFHPICTVAVSVLRPPGPEASHSARARYNAWYRGILNISDDTTFLDVDDEK